MTITARILYFIAFWAYLAIGVGIGLAHDQYVMAQGHSLNVFAFSIVIIMIIGAFASAMICMINSAKD